eukprot:jgi/Botrbrau1/4461/Bobra.0348s0045.2
MGLGFNAVQVLRGRENNNNVFLDSKLNEIRTRALDLSDEKCLVGNQREAINWLDLDLAEQRYLLSASSDSAITAYDVLVPTVTQAKRRLEKHDPLFKIDKSWPGGHKYAVSCVVWYPVDTGLLISGGHDNVIKVWDTNSLQVVTEFQLSAPIMAAAMSAVATAHCLVAVGCGAPLQLCDPVSGAVVHTLVGHKSDVWAATWSLASEWHVLSGGTDGQVLLWDIRAARCIHVFDQHQTAREAQASWTGLLPGPGNHMQTQRAHEGSITGIVASPDGLSYVTAGTDSCVRLWDAHTYRLPLILYYNNISVCDSNIGYNDF